MSSCIQSIIYIIGCIALLYTTLWIAFAIPCFLQEFIFLGFELSYSKFTKHKLLDKFVGDKIFFSNFTILAQFYDRENLTRIMVLLCPHQTEFLVTYPFIMLWWWANTSTLLSSSPPVYNERNSTTGATCNDLPKTWHVKELKKLINPELI